MRRDSTDSTVLSPRAMTKVVNMRRVRSVAAAPAVAEHGGGDEEEEFVDPEEYWQTAYCAALRSIAVGRMLGESTRFGDAETARVVAFAKACADAALDHALLDVDADDAEGS